MCCSTYCAIAVHTGLVIIKQKTEYQAAVCRCILTVHDVTQNCVNTEQYQCQQAVAAMGLTTPTAANRVLTGWELLELGQSVRTE